jgi:hypothetical protein
LSGRVRRLLSLVLFLGLLLPFQNCGEGFRSAQGSVDLSSQCMAKVRTESKVQPTNCGQAEEYVCERRLFSPAVADEEMAREECVEPEFCVTVTTRSFNTDGLRGEEYDREEVRCAHSSRERDIALFVGEGKSLTAALDQAIALCWGKSEEAADAN